MAEMSAEAGTKTLWMGDLAYWMDESFVYSIFVGAPHGSPSLLVWCPPLTAQCLFYSEAVLIHLELSNTLEVRRPPLTATSRDDFECYLVIWMYIWPKSFFFDTGLSPDAGTGQLVSVKIIRNKNTAVSEGYGFVEFATHEAAEQVLRTFNGCPIPNTDQIFRLNWAAFGVGKVTTDGKSPLLRGRDYEGIEYYVLADAMSCYFILFGS